MFENIIGVFYQDPLAQIIGLLATAVVLYAFLQKDDSKIIKILLCAHVLWIIHFGLLGVYVAMIISAMGALRKGLALKFYRNKKVFYIIICMTLILSGFTYSGWISFLPLIASLLSTYGFFFLEKLKLRIVFFISSNFWLIYSYINGSIGGVINEILVQIIQIYVIYKILHSHGITSYYLEKITGILRKPKVDYGRFLAFFDLRNLLAKRKQIQKLFFPWQKLKSIWTKKSSQK